MNNKFLSLSPELLLTICDKLCLTNLKNLRLSCKLLAERLSFLVLSNIGIKATSIEDLISQLRFLTNPPSVAVNCTTRITIHGFNQIFGRFEDFLMGLKHDRISNADRQKMRDEFCTAFTSLKSVRMMRWFSHKYVPPWFQESIWSAIRCLPALRALYLETTFLNINLDNLNTLIALESISISEANIGQFERTAALFENVSKLYASSTNLTSIELNIPEESDLYHLLAFRPKVDPAIRLRHLAIAGIPVSTDENTLHHLSNLTSLKLSLPIVGFPDEIWNAFRLSRIHLQELDIGHFAMGHAVNDYLSSFSGLKKLRLLIDGLGDQESLDASADKFWSNSFLNHVDTLLDFDVQADYYGQWCFGDHNRSVIARCTKLKHFAISVYPSDIPTRESDSDRITPLIETVLTHMTHIEHLGLNVPLSSRYQGSRFGSQDWATEARLQYQLNDWILKYEPAPRFRDRFAEVDVFLNRKMVIGRN